jgi:hypothetical protein
MLLLDLPTRLDARFATVAMADRPPSNRRLAGRDGRIQLKLIHRVVARGLAARKCPRQVETGDDRDGLAALADSVACHGIGLRYCRGCRRGAGEAAPPAGVNSGPARGGEGGAIARWITGEEDGWIAGGVSGNTPPHRDCGVNSIILPVRRVPRSRPK